MHVRDTDEVVEYMNFGGKLVVGQSTTGSCSAEKVCHCNHCTSTSDSCSECEYSTWNANP